MTRMPRWSALIVLFIVAMLYNLVVMPIALGPLVCLDEGLSEALREYTGYLRQVFWPPEWLNDPDFFRAFAIVSVVGALLQVAFIAPLVGKLRLLESGYSLRSSVISAIALALLLVLGVVLTLLETAGLLFTAEGFGALVDNDGTIALVVVIGLWLIMGAPWAWVLWKAGASRNPSGIALLTRRLLAGTALELALSIPVYALARRREDCYCALPTFWSIAIGIASLLCLCGPLAMLFVTRNARRNWSRAACVRCGYPRRSGAPACSECGHAFATA